MNFKVYIALFNFQSACTSLKSACFIIYHQFRFCQINFEDFLIFYSASRNFQLNFVSLQFGAFHNILLIFILFKSFSKLFSKFFIRPDFLFNQLFLHPHFSMRRKTRYNISSYFALSSGIFIFYLFFIQPAQLSHSRGRRTGT